MKPISGIFNFQPAYEKKRGKKTVSQTTQIQLGLANKQDTWIKAAQLFASTLSTWHRSRAGGGGRLRTLRSGGSGQPKATALAGDRLPTRKGFVCNSHRHPAQHTRPQPGPSPPPPGCRRGSGSCFGSTAGTAVGCRQQSVLLHCLVSSGRQSNGGCSGDKGCASAMATCTSPRKHTLSGFVWWRGARSLARYL